MDDETRRRMLVKMATAAKNNDVEVALALIQEAAALPEAFSWGTQGLRIASEEGHIEMVKALLSVSDPKAYDSQALLSAAENGHVSLVEFLIPISDPKAGGSKALREAAKKGRADIVAVLIGWGHKEEKISEAMESAVRGGHAVVVKTMLEAKLKNEAEGGEVPEDWGGAVCGPKCAANALCMAASHGKQDVVEMLAKGAPQYATGQAMMWAAAAGRVEVAGWFLSHADCGDWGRKALARAAGEGHSNVVELHIGGVDENARREAFEVAAKRCKYKTMELLVDCCGPLAPDSMALEHAASAGNLEWVRRLLPMSAPMARESHALREACCRGKVELIELLLPFSDAGSRGEYPGYITTSLEDEAVGYEDSPSPKDCSIVMAAVYGGGRCLRGCCVRCNARGGCLPPTGRGAKLVENYGRERSRGGASMLSEAGSKAVGGGGEARL